MADWNPAQYEAFADQRLQPALDLLARVGSVPEGDVIDLGCGNGPVGPALAARFGTRRLIGMDNSPAMLARAAERGVYAALEEADIAGWAPEGAPAVIYSNAALQWLGDHDTLIPALARRLAPGGMLAVQMPAQNAAPSHAGWSRAWRAVFADRPVATSSQILTGAQYHDLLSPLGEMRVWQTEYLQHLAPVGAGHPVRQFTQATFGRPFLAGLDRGARDRLIAAYEAELRAAYPPRQDGSVLFPFRRLFFTLRRR